MSALAAVGWTARAEWGRIWSVRSSWLLVGVTAAVVLGVGTLVGSSSDPGEVTPGSTAWDGGQPTALFALFGVLALSVVLATADHATGGIVPTLQWTPRRGVLLAARVGVLVLTGTGLGVLLVGLAGLVVWLFLPELGLPPGDGAAVLGDVALLLSTGAGLGVGLGLLLRSTAGGLLAVIGLVLVLPFVLAQLDYDWSTGLAARLPGAGALFLVFGEGPSDDMTAASARVTLALWAVGALTLGGWRLLRSDADR